MSDVGLDPRRAAWQILKDTDRGLHFDQALNEGLAHLGDADRRLAHELAAGVLRQQRRLDERLTPLITRGIESVDPNLLTVLRIGAYQLERLDRIPPHAAVATSVSLAKEIAGASGAGFVNAVLRRLTRAPRPSDSEPSPAATDDQLGAAYSHPDWLVSRWLERFGRLQTEELLAWNNRTPPLVVQPARWTVEELTVAFATDGIAVVPAPFDAGLIPTQPNPRLLPGYSAGGFLVQDAAHALVVRFAGVAQGNRVYDVCAAPGGKALAFAHLGGRVVAGDMPGRMPRLRENIDRAGTGHEWGVVMNALAPAVRPVDLVFLDAPCLGTGTFARNPDARWRVGPEGLMSLVEQGGRFLRAAAEAVRPGGLLCYATCSLEPEENEEQVDRFLRWNPRFHRESNPALPRTLMTDTGDLMILPQLHGMDGAYAARLRRDPA